MNKKGNMEKELNNVTREIELDLDKKLYEVAQEIDEGLDRNPTVIERMKNWFK